MRWAIVPLMSPKLGSSLLRMRNRVGSRPVHGSRYFRSTVSRSSPLTVSSRSTTACVSCPASRASLMTASGLPSSGCKPKFWPRLSERRTARRWRGRSCRPGPEPGCPCRTWSARPQAESCAGRSSRTARSRSTRCSAWMLSASSSHSSSRNAASGSVPARPGRRQTARNQIEERRGVVEQLPGRHVQQSVLHGDDRPAGFSPRSTPARRPAVRCAMAASASSRFAILRRVGSHALRLALGAG